MELAVTERYSELKEKLREANRDIYSLKVLKENHLKKAQQYTSEMDSKEEELEIVKKSRIVFQNLTDDRNKVAKEGIEGLVNYALNAVFENNRYSLLITDDTHGLNMITKIELLDKDTNRLRLPKKSNGNAVKQIISFIFTVALLEFSNSSKIIILDETLSGLSREFCPRFGDIITALAKNNGFQFLIVNHNETLFSSDDFGVINLEMTDTSVGLQVTD